MWSQSLHINSHHFKVIICKLGWSCLTALLHRIRENLTVESVKTLWTGLCALFYSLLWSLTLLLLQSCLTPAVPLCFNLFKMICVCTLLVLWQNRGIISMCYDHKKHVFTVIDFTSQRAKTEFKKLSNIFRIFIIICVFFVRWGHISQLQPALVTHGNQNPATVWEWSWPAMRPNLSLDPILLIHLLSRQQKQGCVHRQPAPSYLTDLIELNLLSWSRTAVWSTSPTPQPHPKFKKRGRAARTQSVQKATTLQGEEKERSTIWGLVMVMPGAQGQG